MRHHYIITKQLPGHQLENVADSRNIKDCAGWKSRDDARHQGTLWALEKKLNAAHYYISVISVPHTETQNNFAEALHMSGNYMHEGTWDEVINWIGRQADPREYRAVPARP